MSRAPAALSFTGAAPGSRRLGPIRSALRVMVPLLALAAMVPDARAQYPGQVSPYGGPQPYRGAPAYAAPMGLIQRPGMTSWFTAHPEARAATLSQCGRMPSAGTNPGCALASSSAGEEAERRERQELQVPAQLGGLHYDYEATSGIGAYYGHGARGY